MTEEKELHCLPMKECVKRLLHLPAYHDCSFVFLNDDNKVLHANKLILSTASPVFRAMFFGEMANDQPVKIDDIKPTIFQLVLDFIYTDTCNLILKMDDCCSLYNAANKYMIPVLKKLCLPKIESKLNSPNACKTYEFAELFEIESLMVLAEDRIVQYTNDVLRSTTFLDCKLSTLLSILDKKKLNISSECELIDAVVQWGRKECERRGLPGYTAKFRSIIDEPLKKIRFLSLSSKEFIEKHDKSKMLNETEFCSLLVNIVVPHTTSYPVPKGFSTDKVKHENDGFPFEITARIKYLLDSQKFTDCSFIIKDQASSKGVKYSAHKLILSMGCPAFREMLEERMTDNIITEIKPEYFKLMLDYIYADNCKLPESAQESFELSLIAIKFRLPLLSELCIGKMISKVTHTNAFEIYEKARHLNLRESHPCYYHCLKLIVQESTLVFQDPSFEDIQLKTLLNILDIWQNYLNVSQTSLFEAVVRWARKECKRRGLPEDDENLKVTIDPALKKIHFLAFSATDFAKGPGESKILTDSDFRAILMNILKPDTTVPMPDGFCTIRDKPVPQLAAQMLSSAFPTVQKTVQAPVYGYYM